MALEKLSELVKTNQLAEIKKIVMSAKKTKGYLWMRDGEKLYAENALRDAILLNKVEMVKFFFDEGISPNTYANVDDTTGCLPLIHFAAKAGSLSMVKLLIESGVEEYDSGMSAAVQADNMDIITYLLKQGANADGLVCDDERYTLRKTYLGKAALNGNIKLASLLANSGANIMTAIKLNHQSFTALHNLSESVIHQHTQGLKILFDHAMGVDLYDSSYTKDKKFCYLEGINISGFNFIGISYNGKPVTKDMLAEEKLNGANDALTTFRDIKDTTSFIVKERLEQSFKQHGKLIDSEAGTINFVPLWKAVEIGEIEVVKTRLSAGANPNFAGHGNTKAPIVIAAGKGFIDIVALLLQHPQFDKKTLLEAINAAKQNKHLQLTEHLFLQQDVNQKDNNGNALLHHAVNAGDITEIKNLLTRGADVNLIGKDRYYPLHLAAQNSYDKHLFNRSSKEHIEIIHILLEHKADANVTRYGLTPLSYAVSAGSSQAVKLLLPHTIKRVTESEDKQTLPWYVSMFDSCYSIEWLDILKLLHADGADLNFMHPVRGNTLLNTVFQMITNRKTLTEKLDILDFLLESGANPNGCNKYGDTTLHTFLQNSDLKDMQDGYDLIIQRCLKKGFNLTSVDHDGRTLLHLAALRKNVEAATYFIQLNKFDINAEDKQGQTPLHLASASSPEITQLFIAAKANPSLYNFSGETPRDFSKICCQNESSRYFFTSTEAKEEFASPYKKTEQLLIEAEAKQRDEQKSKQQITVVFDLDMTLVTGFDDIDFRNIQSTPLASLLMQKELFIHAITPHMIHIGTIELLQTLDKLPNIRIAFFSGGIKERNEILVEKLLCLALGVDRYHAIKNQVIVYSSNQLDLSRSIPNSEAAQLAISSGEKKKNLKKVVKSANELAWTVLIDDSPSYTYPGQLENLLYITGAKFSNYCQEFQPVNQIFYATGMLFSALEMIKNKNISLADALFKMQYERVSESEASFNYSLWKNMECYKKGLNILQKVNPSLRLITSEKSFKEYQINKKSARSVEEKPSKFLFFNNAINALRSNFLTQSEASKPHGPR